MRSLLGSYLVPVMISGTLCVLTALLVLGIGRDRAGRDRLQAAAA